MVSFHYIFNGFLLFKVALTWITSNTHLLVTLFSLWVMFEGSLWPINTSNKVFKSEDILKILRIDEYEILEYDEFKKVMSNGKRWWILVYWAFLFAPSYRLSTSTFSLWQQSWPLKLVTFTACSLVSSLDLANERHWLSEREESEIRVFISPYPSLQSHWGWSSAKRHSPIIQISLTATDTLSVHH